MSADLPAGRNLCTIENVKNLVPGYDPDDDTEAALTDFIESISVDVYDDISREFVPRSTDPETRRFEIDWFTCQEREIPIGDLAQIDDDTTVEIISTDGTVLQTLDPGAYVALPRARDAWEPITSLQLPRVALSPAQPAQLPHTGFIDVTGNYGFPSIPANVRKAVAKLVICRYVTDIAETGTALSDALDNINIGVLYASATASLSRYRPVTIG